MMDSDDGTQAFGELGQSEPNAVHWDTPEWREEMRERYDIGDEWEFASGTRYLRGNWQVIGGSDRQT